MIRVGEDSESERGRRPEEVEAEMDSGGGLDWSEMLSIVVVLWFSEMPSLSLMDTLDVDILGVDVVLVLKPGDERGAVCKLREVGLKGQSEGSSREDSRSESRGVLSSSDSVCFSVEWSTFLDLVLSAPPCTRMRSVMWLNGPRSHDASVADCKRRW